MSGRVIDFALFRGCDVDVVDTDWTGGSDHKLVLFDVTPRPLRRALQPARPLRVGLWNMQRDRPVDAVAQLVDYAVEHWQLDALLLTESGDYLPALRRRQHAARWRVLGASASPGQNNTCLVLRDGLPFERFGVHRATRAGWTTSRGGHTPPKYLASVRVDRWLWLCVGHRAPSVRWRGRKISRLTPPPAGRSRSPRSKILRFPVGPVRRVASTIAHARSELRWARRHPGPVLLAEDWNAVPSEPGRWSPRWVARRAGLRIAAPSKGTHR